MGKNIALFADGTGNKGGYTPDSNVYRMYHAVDIRDTQNPQLVFYDNGVGTSTNKILRGLGGAVGFGFATNVCDLYRFLASSYEPGNKDSGGDRGPDKVYLFGFSRGAATIRALSGFIATCGLVDGRGLHNKELTKRVNEAFANYRKWRRNPELANPRKEAGRSHGVIDVEFIGVWDTVSALGFPQRTDITSAGLWVLNWLFVLLDHLTDKLPFLAHLFYNYELTDNVQHACQALALDDARTAFWPWVWDEHGRTKDNVEQVWFAGMHSNVGGGYNRSGLAKVALEWMMVRAHHHGLKLRDDKVQEIKAEAHVHGRMYDSRDGFAVYYRYHPRELDKLCRQDTTFLSKVPCDEQRPFAVTADELASNPGVKRSCNKLLGEIKVHSSVIERMFRRTANYAPTQLPGKFAVVETGLEIPEIVIEPAADPDWAEKQKQVGKWILKRKSLYGMMLESTLVMIVFAIFFWNNEPEKPTQVNGVMQHIADALNYVLPDMFGGLITVVVLQEQWIFWAMIAFVLAYLWVRGRARKKTVLVAERIRRLVMQALKS